MDFSFFCILFLFFWCLRLSTRLTALEQKDKNAIPAVPVAPVTHQQTIVTPVTENISSVAESVTQSAIMPVATQTSELNPSIATSQPLPTQNTPKPDPIMVWLGENTLIKVGAFFFFLGAVWFVSYAISEGWISPLARILFGILLGLVVCAVGFWRKKTNVEHYLVLTTLGVGIVIASIYAGQFLFHIFSPLVALVLLVLTITYAVVVSIDTKAEWLCVASAITSLVAPLLVNAPSSELTPFFLYLLSVTAAFSVVVFFTHWRSVNLTFVVGVSLAEVSAYSSGMISPDILWIFVLVFSAFFFASATISMLRSNTPVALDIVSLGAASGVFVGWMMVLTEHKALIALGASLICVLTGYLCYFLQKSTKLITVYAAFASVLALLSTSFAFDGFTLTLVYTFEIAISIVLVMFLRLSNRVVGVVSYAFLIPICVSISDVGSSLWESSALHPSAYALYALTLTTLALSAFAQNRFRLEKNPLYQTIGVSFAALFWFYAHVCAWLIFGALFDGDTTEVLRYVSWTLITLFVVAYSAVQKLPRQTFYIAMASFLVPIATSVSVLNLSASTSPFAPAACGLYFMAVVAFGVCSWLVWCGKKENDAQIITAGAIALAVAWLYAVAGIYVYWGALITDTDSLTVLRYVTWSLLSLLLIAKVLFLRTPASWIGTVVATFALPVFVSVGSLTSSQWELSWMHPHALGLYALACIIFAAASLLYRSIQTLTDDTESYLTSSKLLFIFFGLYVTALVWLVAGAVFGSVDVAVSVALLIYTVAGLCLYTIGRTTNVTELRYAGIVLLTGVVGRLLLVDVWRMAILGRIVTFLGVGLLFILTALFEKPFDTFKK